MRALAVLALSAFASIVAAQGGQGDGQGQGGGQGGQGGQVRQRSGDPSCGREVVVIKPDGTRQRFESVEGFLDAFPRFEIDQGEAPRRAVKLDVLLKAYGADWVEALDCNDRSEQLPGGMPVRYVEYFVLTGRGTLKGIREVGRNRYVNTVQGVRKLTFHAASAKKAAPAKQ